MKIVTPIHLIRIVLVFLNVMVFVWGSVQGQVSLTTATYTQDFNTLISSGSSGTLPPGWVFSESGTNANTTYTAGTGSSTIGDTYSFGAILSAERAFGILQSGSLNPIIGASFTNNTGSTINEIAIEYTGEQWRLGESGREDRLDFQYSINASSLITGSWIDFNALNFIAPVTTGTVGSLNGNHEANQTNMTATITGLSISPGETFRIRWSDYNATGSDDGLAIDEFYLSATSTCNVNITALEPASGPAGTVVSLTGTNLTGATDVYFDGIAATFKVVTSSSIVAIVPENASSGSLTVHNACASASSGSFNILNNSCTTGATDLFISEYIEGSSNNKAIEIANFTGNSINLTGYTLTCYFNGNSSPNLLATLPNIDLPNNQVWVIVAFNASPALLAIANQITSIGWFNGNDAVVLKKGGTDIDIFGNIGCNPGKAWTEAGMQTNDVTLVRKNIVFNGISTNPAVCTFPTLITEWDQYTINDYSHLGNHSAIYTTTPPTITSHPVNTEVFVGETTVLTTIATGATSYQWKWLNGNTWQNVTDRADEYSGATTPSLTIRGTNDLNGTQYYCEAYSTNNCLTVSHAVKLTVNSTPDTTKPTFMLPEALSECVEILQNISFDIKTNSINASWSDYFTFIKGNKALDLDISKFTDNCPLTCPVEIRWRIDMKGGSRIPATPIEYQTGQPSTYSNDIQFSGDGVTFGEVVHTITYWIVDCAGNVSDPQIQTITIQPRPSILVLK